MTLWVVVADDVGGPGFALDTARGLWASLLYLCLLATLALAAATPSEPRMSHENRTRSPRTGYQE